MSFSLGGIVKGIGNVIGGAIKATPIGGAISQLAGAVSGAFGPTVQKIVSTPIAPLPGPAIITQPRVMTAPNLPALPAQTGIVKGGGDVTSGSSVRYSQAPGQVTVRGHWKKNGQWSNRRRPRMNPMNVRAARRATNRIHAAEKLFRRILSVSHPGKPHGHIAPKRRKRA